MDLFFKIVVNINTILLIVYAFLSILILKNKYKGILKYISIYLIFSCASDVLSRLMSDYLVPKYLSDTLFTGILYRLGELLLVGFLINKFWLKIKSFWVLIGLSCLYLIYELLTYRNSDIFNYLAYAQIVANVILCIMLLINLIKQLNSKKIFSLRNQIFNMIFLTYFTIHFIYTVITNFIINQSFSNQSFNLFYSSYVILHILYYFALSLILFVTIKNIKEFK